MPRIRAHNDPEFRYESNNRVSATDKYIPNLAQHHSKQVREKKKKDLQEEADYIEKMSGEVKTYYIAPERKEPNI